MRLVLVNVLLVHTLTVWRVKREEKKADVFDQNNLPLPSSLSPLIEQNFVFVQLDPPLPDVPPGLLEIIFDINSTIFLLTS